MSRTQLQQVLSREVVPPEGSRAIRCPRRQVRVRRSLLHRLQEAIQEKRERGPLCQVLQGVSSV